MIYARKQSFGRNTEQRGMKGYVERIHSCQRKQNTLVGKIIVRGNTFQEKIERG